MNIGELWMICYQGIKKKTFFPDVVSKCQKSDKKEVGFHILFWKMNIILTDEDGDHWQYKLSNNTNKSISKIGNPRESL